jgi:hypothetical protein
VAGNCLKTWMLTFALAYWCLHVCTLLKQAVKLEDVVLGQYRGR